MTTSQEKTLYFTCDFNYIGYQCKTVKMSAIDIVEGALYQLLLENREGNPLAAVQQATYNNILKPGTRTIQLYDYPHQSGSLDLCKFAFSGSKLQPSNKY